MSSSPALTVERVSVFNDNTPLVRDISFSIPIGASLTLLGESGSGKSLLAQAIMGNLPAPLRCQGRIHIGGECTAADDQRSRHTGWGRRLALLPQEPWLALDPTMKVGQQVQESYELAGQLAAKSGGASRASLRRQAQLLCADSLAGLGLQDAAQKYPFMISGGMAQRIAFLATHAAATPLMIIDEPTKGLDADRRGEVIELLRAAQAQGISLLCITHDIWLARALGGQLAVMFEGSLIERGGAARVFAAPQEDYTQRLLAADPTRWVGSAPAGPAAERRIIVSVEGATKSYGRQTVFSGVDAQIAAGEIVAVSGPSGSGKTTFGNIVMGLLTPNSGHVSRGKALAPNAFQKILQDPCAAFAPRISLRQSLHDLAALHRLDWARLEHLLERVRLPLVLLDRLPHQVSGGELQRIALARVLLMRPALIFADEPTSRLDPVTQKEVIDLLLEHVRATQCAILLVTHDTDLARSISHRQISL